MVVDAWQASQFGVPAMPADYRLYGSLSASDRKPDLNMTTFVDNMLCHHLGGHDGAALRKSDIWLGDYDDHSNPVNGKSVEDFILLANLVGRTHPRVPDTMRGSARQPEYLRCHQCRHARTLTVVCMPFMDGMIWTLPFTLGQRRVFAIIKKSKHHPGNWIFWSTKGFYRTASFVPMLENTPARKKIPPGNARSCSKPGKCTAKRPRDSSLQPEKEAKKIKVEDAGCQRGWWLDAYDSDSDYDSLDEVPAKPLPGPTSIVKACDTGMLAQPELSASASPEDNIRMRSPKRRASPTAVPALKDSAAHSKTDEAATIERPLAGQVADPVPTPAEELVLMSSSEHKMQSPSYSLRFRLWLKVDWNPNRSVVFLDDSMSVESVYERIASVLLRKLEGKEMVGLTVGLPEQEPFDVEPGNADAWEVLLEMVREAGLTAVEGTVLRKE